MTPRPSVVAPADGIARSVSIRDLCFARDAGDGISRKVRTAQIGTIGPIIVVTNLTNLINAIVIVASLWAVIPNAQLCAWLAAILLMWVIRLVAVPWIRRSLSTGNGATGFYIFCMATLSATLWCVPPVFWAAAASPEQQLLMAMTIIGMMCGGSIIVAIFPPAALSYLIILTAGLIWLSLTIGMTSLLVMMVLLPVTLCAICLWFAGQFVAHLRARLELEEHAQLIELLREFKASGSGGLWETDADLIITSISDGLAAAIGKPAPAIVGLSVHQLLDPLAKIALLSTGMRTLFENFEQGIAFRDLAVPAVDSDRWWSLSGKPVTNAKGEMTGWRGVGSDITGLRLSGGDAINAARTDPLTGLANRLLVRELLEEALLRQLDGTKDCALLLVDLDRFKLVNDTLGHAIGDHLLCEVARRLEAAVADGGRAGRLGGDEFVIIWTNGSDRATLGALADRICTELSKSFSIGAASLHIGATIGIACGLKDGQSEGQLMGNADLALYRAKEQGRGGHAFFEHDMLVAAEDHRLIENDVRNALDGGGLWLAYQPIVDAATGVEVGREVLMRWRHPERGDIPPDLFIPIIEDIGLIHQIGDWAIREACQEAASWAEPLRIAVNVSAAQVTGPGLAQTVLGALAASGLSPDCLELEVTESVFLGDDVATLASLERLRSLGVRLVLDDFGKGYSSFGYLSRAQFSKIKIDQAFVRDAAQGGRESTAIVNAILALARGLGVDTTAEGIETADQAEAMRALGCTQLQGFYFGRPRPAAALGGARVEAMLLAS